MRLALFDYRFWEEILMFFKKKECIHNWKITEKSNAIQQDDMGYPLRLFICTCSKCGKSDQIWIDVAEKELEELKNGKSVLVKWEDV